MTREVLFQSADVIVNYERRDSDTLLAAFGHMGMVGSTELWASDLANALGWSLMAINPMRRSWYPYGGFNGLPYEVGAICRSYRRRISYGGSMGGHGAVKNMRVFGATMVIAGAPQISIDPADVGGFDRRFEGLFDLSVQGRGAIVPTDITAETFVLVDQSNAADFHHASAIAALSQRVHILSVPNTHHEPLSALAGTKVFRAFVDALEKGNMAAAHRVMSEQRRRLDARKASLIVRSWARRPTVAQSILTRLEETAKPNLLGETYWRIGKIDEYRGELESARAMYRRATAANPRDPIYSEAAARLP
jgi:hypothetical protein